MTNFSAEQKTYMQAKAALDTVLTEYQTLSEGLRWSDRQPIRARLNINALESAVKEAETALLSWGWSRIQNMPGASEVTAAFQTADSIIRSKMVELTLKLTA